MTNYQRRKKRDQTLKIKPALRFIDVAHLYLPFYMVMVQDGKPINDDEFDTFTLIESLESGVYDNDYGYQEDGETHTIEHDDIHFKPVLTLCSDIAFNEVKDMQKQGKHPSVFAFPFLTKMDVYNLHKSGEVVLMEDIPEIKEPMEKLIREGIEIFRLTEKA